MRAIPILLLALACAGPTKHDSGSASATGTATGTGATGTGTGATGTGTGATGTGTGATGTGTGATGTGTGATGTGTGTGATFSCGPVQSCAVGQYCSEFIPGVPPGTPQYSCVAGPPGCGPVVDCACLGCSGGPYSCVDHPGLGATCTLLGA